VRGLSIVKKILCVAGMSAAVCVMSATSASADTGAFGSNVVANDQTGLVIIDAPLVDLRCATPWFGSAVLGATLPIGMQSIVCDEVNAPVSQAHTGDNALL
jgi:hypothetical protein